MACGLQTLHYHSGWEEALPVNLKSLYDALLSGHLDVNVRLAHRHSNQPVTLRKLLRMSGKQISTMMVEPTACLAFAAKYSWDEESPQGRRFAGMCGESACLGAMLTEVSTHHLMTSMSWHMYNSLDPNLVRPQDDLQKMKVCAEEAFARVLLSLTLQWMHALPWMSERRKRRPARHGGPQGLRGQGGQAACPRANCRGLSMHQSPG